mgnify:CR=1 FL=1
MKKPLPLLVFSDLDGTLLSHVDYSWEAARPALQQLHLVGAGLVLASSKTAAEIIPLRAQLGFEDWPAIVENGAGLLAANETQQPERDQYDAIRQVLGTKPLAVRAPFRGFGDMDAAQIAASTGLSEQDAARAALRAYSEPGLWSGSLPACEDFLSALAEHGISAREGGRFLTLSFGRTKADQMAQIIQTLRPDHTIALGDAPNDTEMIAAADAGIIVANPHRKPLPPMDGETSGQIVRTMLPGPEGWNAAVLDVVQQRGLTGD